MSESEKKKRLEYRKNRRKLLLIQSVIAIFLGLTILLTSIVYFRANTNYHVSYKEQSAIDYKVYLKPNNEYEEDYLGKDQSYIATLIDYVDISFTYVIDLDSEWANYQGSYSVDAKLTIRDNSNRKVIFTHTYPLKDKTLFEHYGNNKLLIDEQITVGYDQYNEFATNFKNIYNLEDVTCYLDVAMHVDTNGQCKEFENTDFGSCSFSLNVPLTKKTIEINMLSSIPSGREVSITCEECTNRDVFKYIALSALFLEIVVVITLLIYAYSTRNHDINYEIKIKRLVSAYKSYVQKILTEFCYDGYRVLKVETFNEMLDIRDTINSPILMSENVDKTCTKFLIPTDNNILYVFEIKVEDYDEIYADKIPTQEIVEKPVQEVGNEIEVQKLPVEAKIETVEETEENDEHHYRKGPSYNYSFLAKLHLSNEQTRDCYQEISSFVQSYGLKVNRSWNKERIQVGKKTYAILSFKGLKLVASFALNPADYQDTKYKLIDASASKKFAQVPAQMKVTSARKTNWVKELLIDMLTKDGVENKNLNVQAPKVKAKSKAKLIKESLIRVK